ncbi:MAG: efflux RND transporter periplasmic adaptor subunit [Candidatus Pacebacteria bacterium]|nr:efflux RND transporter periplasmic adaptor subunit [Candidatus Paceibacterota bacterium]
MKSVLVIHLRTIGIIICILVAGGAVWYFFSNTTPVLGTYTVERGNVTSSVDIPGTVSSSNSVNLSFQESGQISKVYVKEGDTVTAGEALAKLDDSTEQTQLSQEEAVLAAAEAKLNSLKAGATPEDIAVSQSAVNAANQGLVNLYASINDVAVTGYGKATDAVQTQLGTMFNNMQLVFQNNVDSQSFISANTKYSAASLALNNWQQELSTVSASSSNSNLGSVLQDSITYLNTVSDLLQYMSTLLNNNNVTISLTSLAAYRINVSTGISEVNLASQNLSTLSQNIASQKLAVAQAQAALDVTQAGSTQNDIDAQQAVVLQAQAAINNAQIMINNTTIVAPFAGIARNVTAQVGMVVSPNIPVLSIINNNIMKVDAYASEIDVSKIEGNAAASVTLDSYGNDIKFPAKVTAVDTSETVVNGSPAYHVTLYFTEPDARIMAGMTGNVLITAAEHDNVVEVPSSLVLDNGGIHLVLVQDNGKSIPRAVTLGLSGDDGMIEIISGLNIGEKISDF